MRLLGALQRLALRPSPRNVLLGGALAALAVRLALSIARSGPVIQADEAGYLMHARVLAGGMPAEMGFSPFYRGGYSLLLAPILSLHADPVATYHAVLVVNALLAACLVPLLYLLLTRCFDAAPLAAAWAAVAAAAYPTVTVLSQVVKSENALFVLTVSWLLAVGCLLRARARGGSIAWAAAAGFAAAALWTVHGRMIVAVCVTALVLAVAAGRGRHGRIAAAAGLVALAGGMLAGHLLNDWLVATNYDGRGGNEIATVRAALADGDGVLAALRNLVGQSWYLATATLGVGLLLAARVAPPALGRLRRRRAEPGDELLAVLLTTTAGLLVLSALWFATSTRPDQPIYGRYVEPVVPALIAVGLVLFARLGRPARPLRLIVGLAALTVTVAAPRAALDLPGEVNRWNVASLPSLTGTLGAPVIVLAGVVSCATLWLLVLAGGRSPSALAPLVAVLFMPTTAYVAKLPVLRSQAEVYPSGWTSPEPIVRRRHAASVGYDLDHLDHVRVKVYQWYMPHTPVLLFHGDTEAAPATVFFSGRRLTGRPWTDPGADQALWQRPAAGVTR